MLSKASEMPLLELEKEKVGTSLQSLFEPQASPLGFIITTFPTVSECIMMGV